MASLRRSGRVRQPIGGDESGPSSIAGDEVDGSAGRPKRKRASSSASASGSPERSRRANSSAAGSPASREDDSPVRSRSGRRIVVKGSSQGRFNKAAKVGSEAGSAGAHAGDSDEDAEGEDDDGEDGAESQSPEGASRANGKAQNASTSPLGTRSGKAVAPKTESSQIPEGKGQFDLKVESEDEGERAEADNVHILPELVLRDTDKEKLSVVIHAFAPDLLKMRVAPSKPHPPQDASSSGLGISVNGTTKRTSGAERRAARSDTLDDLLVAPKVTLQRLREHFMQLQAPLVTTDALRAHVTGSHVAPPRDGVQGLRSRLKTISTCLALIDEIARRQRMEEEGIKAQAISAKAEAGNEYALQMRLPMGDYFTNAVWLADKDAAALDTGHAHLVNVALAPVARQKVGKNVPTLGERLHQGPSPSQLKKQQAGMALPPPPMREKRYQDEDYAKPVSHLYYGPWSSFAPTYDSFDGQLSYKASCALWRNKRDERVVLERWAEEEADSIKAGLKQALHSLGDDDVDVDAVLAAYDELPAAPCETALDYRDVDAVLEHNASLLRQLHEHQESRWRRLVALETKAVEDGEDAELEPPSKIEHALAHDLMDSLTSLLTTRPRHKDKSIVPTALRLQAVSSSAAVDPALLDGRAEAGMWGTFGDDIAVSAKSALKQPSPQALRRPASMCDNETIKMSGDAEERAAVHLANLNAPASNSAASTGPAARSGSAPQGVSARQAQAAPHANRMGQDARLNNKASPAMQPARRPFAPQGSPHHHGSPRGPPERQYATGSQTPFARPAHPSLGVGAPAPQTRS